MKIKLFNPLVICIIIILFPVMLFAQQKGIDSLKSVLAKYATVNNFESDTNYLKTLNELAFKYNNINPDTTILLGGQIVELCNKINYTVGKVEALKSTGLAFNVKGEYSRALTYFSNALDIALKSGYTRGAGKIYQNTGIVYSNIGKYPEALENYFQSLKIREELGDKLGISSSTNGIGGIYFVQGKYADALNNYLKALKIAEEINYVTGIESAYANIGEVYFRQGKYEEAHKNLLKSLKITEQTGNKETRAFISLLIASINSKQGRYEDAITAYIKTKQLARELGSQEYDSRSSLGLGEVYLALKKNDEALQYTQEGITIAKQIGYTEILRDGNETLSRIYEVKGAGIQALYHHRLFKLYADSINNQQTEQRATNLAADYEYSKKEIVLKAEQEKKQVEFQKQTNQQRWIIFSAFAALFSSLVVVWLIHRSRQKEKKVNNLLQKQNIEIDRQKNDLEKTLTTLKATQHQLIQSEKMASLGELTAGIAHEIQNPLNFVNNFSEVNIELIEELKSEKSKPKSERDEQSEEGLLNDIAQNLEKINHHGKRADAIVKGMLQHSRSSSGVKEPTDINALADEYLRLAYHGLRAKDKSFNATMKTDFDESLSADEAGIGNINIIPQDIGRVILNLITNAFYVVDEKKKSGIENYEPTVTVSTKLIIPPPGGTRGARISVKDNGNGIPQKILDKIFQPFFTTKPTGQGTGLGLSMSYDIITKGHGGELKVQTKEGEGAEFIIILPVV